ncbi:MAG TPA: PAS domain-containing protein [Steroidobacteraceae bacterium]|nr:PAS domain-containing protein [Steroidobacteraceae bacterium]
MSTPLHAAIPGDLAPGLFRDMAEQWPGGVIVVNRDGVIRWLNAAAHDWAPAGAGALVGACIDSMRLPWLQDHHDLAMVLGGGSQQLAPRAVIDRHGRERYCGLRLMPLRRGQAICGAMLFVEEGVAVDGSTVVQAPSISDTARAIALSASQVGAWHCNLQSGEGGVDAAWCAALQLDPCTGPGHLARWAKHVHPDDLAAYREGWDEFAQGASDSFEAEFRALTDDSRWMWLLQRGQVVEHDEDGRPLRAAGICIEIDARKRAEVALQEKESRLATALWGARAAFWQWNITSDVSARSAMWFAMTGYQREEWERETRPWHSRLHPDDAERVERTVRDHFEGRTQSLEIEYRIRVASGEYRWVQDRGRVTEWDFQGNPTIAIGVSLDIESQKQAELELRASEARLETAVWGAKIGLWEFDFETSHARWYNDWCDQVDFDACEGADHQSRWEANIHPDDRAEVDRSFDEHLAGRIGHYDAEYRVRTRSGEWRWIFERGRVTARAPDGAPLRMVGVCMDIEERMVAARDAREVRERLERAIDVARIGIWSWDVVDGVFHCNELYADYACGGKVPRDAAERQRVRVAHLHPDDLGEIRALEESVHSGRQDEFECRHRVRHAQGDWRWVLQRGRVTARSADGTPAHMAGFLVDVSDSYEEVMTREKAVAKLQTLAEHTPDYLLLVDRDLRVQIANRGWGAYSTADIVGRSVLDFVPEANRQVLTALYTTVLATGISDERTVGQPRADGSGMRLFVHRASPVRENGVITGLTLAMTDATARLQAEERSRATESVLKTIAEVTPDWLVMLDENQRCTFINRSIAGHEPGEIIGRRLDELPVRVLGDGVRELLQGVLRSGRARTEEHDFHAPDGTSRRFELRVRPVHAAAAGSGTGRGLVVTASDVTTRKTLEREILEIANREQQRMGRDLEDGLIEDLTGIALQLRAVAGQLRKEGSEARADVEDAIGQVNSAIEGTRVLASGLSPVGAERGGLVAALEALAARTRDRHGVQVDVVTQLATPLVLVDGALNHLYRIAQEAVINAVRHGHPRHVRIELALDGGRVRLRVTDDGRGLGPLAAQSAGLGRRVMRYRAQMLDGELTVRPGESGVVVECICPVANNQGAAAF